MFRIFESLARRLRLGLNRFILVDGGGGMDDAFGNGGWEAVVNVGGGPGLSLRVVKMPW